MSNPLADIPDGDAPHWLIGWRDSQSGERGKEIVRAEHSERAVREFEREHPTRKVTNVYQMPNH